MTVAAAVVPARMVLRRLSTGDDQPVPGAANGFDHRSAGRALQLGAQPPHVDLDDVRVTVEIEVPDVVEDVLLRQHLVGMVHEVLEDGELAGGER